jgi:tripartite-type tricarboxylate transporter receptor subunit TctC
VPYAAGGNTDGVARLIGQHYTETFGQQVVVENRTGGGGSLAAEAVARADPDGNTIFMATVSQIAIFPAMNKVNYNAATDFAPISNLISNPFCLVTHKDFPAKTLPQFVAYVKSKPGQFVYASGGVGSLGHLTMALFNKRAGLEMTHTPYRGGGPAMADVIAGHVPVYFGNLSEALPHQGGALNLLAVSGATRAKQLPNMPTVAEQGFPGFQTITWNGFMAPAKTPKAIIDKLSVEAVRGLRDPKTVAKLVNYGVDLIGSTPEEFAATVKADIAMWDDAIKAANIKV